MTDDFDCPVCCAREWHDAGSTSYYASDKGSLGAGWSRLSCALFDVWFSGADRVDLGTLYCMSCGFVTRRPRPTQEDQQAFYDHYSLKYPGASENLDDHAIRRVEALRGERFLEIIEGNIARACVRVLDLGGSNGQLMRAFVAAGHSCYIADYRDCTEDGVTKIADTVDGIPKGMVFDAVLCSHTLEHVTRPGETVARLAPHINDDGVLCAEVPMEVFGGVPYDPITHVNFFTPNSFRRLFAEQGFDILFVREETTQVGFSRMDVSLIVARPGSSAREIHDDAGATETASLLAAQPLLARLSRRWRLHRYPTLGGLAFRLRGMLRRA